MTYCQWAAASNFDVRLKSSEIISFLHGPSDCSRDPVLECPYSDKNSSTPTLSTCQDLCFIESKLNTVLLTWVWAKQTFHGLHVKWHCLSFALRSCMQTSTSAQDLRNIASQIELNHAVADDHHHICCCLGTKVYRRRGEPPFEFSPPTQPLSVSGSRTIPQCNIHILPNIKFFISQRLASKGSHDSIFVVLSSTEGCHSHFWLRNSCGLTLLDF